MDSFVGDEYPPRKVRRVRTGCLTCRARKVKCDEAPTICDHCRGMSLECRWPEKQVAREARASRPAPSRPAHRRPACYSCRDARSKCSQARPLCARCLMEGLTCEYPPPKATPNHSVSRASLQHGQETGTFNHHAGNNLSPLNCTASLGATDVRVLNKQPGAESSQLHTIDHDRGERLVAAFFRHVHPYQANGFLHRGRTLDAARSGKLPQIVLLAICAVGARFSSPPEPARVAARWADEAGRLLIMSCELSVDNLVASLLLGTYTQHAGLFAQTHTWCALANRHAVNLGLHRGATGNEQTPVSWIDAEGRRRLFFASYALERQISNGTPESVGCPAERIKIPLPCEGFNWRLGLVVETPQALLEGDESDVPPWMYQNVGLMGSYVRLVGARYVVKKYVHTLIEQSNNDGIPTIPAPWDPTSPFNTCLSKLAFLKTSLCERLRVTRDVINSRHDTPGLGPRVMIYLWWNMCHVELFRSALNGYPESLPCYILSLAPEGWVEKARQACLSHAKAMTATLEFVSRTMPSEPLVIIDHSLPHLVYASIRVQLENMVEKPPNDSEREQLGVAFEVMLEFVQRMSFYFRPAQLLLKETRRMLSRHSMSCQTDIALESQCETPPNPWFQRQKRLDDERSSGQNVEGWTEEDLRMLEGIFSEIMPESLLLDASNSAGDTNNVNVYNPHNTQVNLSALNTHPVNNFDLTPMPSYTSTHTSNFHSLPGSTPGVISGLAPESHGGIELATAPERRNGKDIGWTMPPPDPLLPDTATLMMGPH